ncbi:nuclear transport factor 2 family protein [Kribbella kalugense]|uniref:SnoaL-like protein n=1 Tax=Kribbella kalugense TaxID=2512221 RepID=A0A4R8A7B5_9ACTN|nr:nuclear transport factor 2 family protein [Kribbella kalugense]TDW24220.1 SnoaL-like protein [Kribbella kalugense]
MTITLADRFELQDLVFNYAHGIDRRDEALFAGLWTPGAIWHFVDEGGLGKLVGYDAIMKGYRQATAGGRRMHHLSSNLILDATASPITGHSDSVATGRETPLFLSYTDEYVKLDGVWKFQLREVHAHLES